MSLYNLRGRDFLCLKDFTGEEIRELVKLGLELKRRYYAGERTIPVLAGRSIGLLFQKPSTRTRISFDVAVYQLGGHPLYLSWRELQLGRGETVPDTARVLSRYLDGIVARVYAHRDLEVLAEYSDAPVINALSDFSHPAQIMADLMTIYEKTGRLSGVKIAFIGDGTDNVLNSLMVAAAKLGMNMSIATPRELYPNRELLEYSMELAGETGGLVEVTEDPIEAVRGANVVYTDVWVSMGQEDEAERKRKLLEGYRVDSSLMQHSPRAIFMHCLPAHRGEEVTSDVIDGPQSVVWDQAENRLHAQKAILSVFIR
ncbi:MAG: ornithine carbamoyltransferase [Desulfurococcales archaeon]|nr:ornithine carbamoyltransferase [Desulfurococcales archaeon]MEB3786830.1 ornithine carbamoyltransferase [Desulfurococcales archaeon]MEB3798758.1 ornithine carbamoyltransferase [Desulfurococcales archaeon]